MREDSASIGKSIVIKGEVSGSENLTIEGQVEGKIELRDHILTVGSTGHVQAHGASDVVSAAEQGFDGNGGRFLQADE